MSNTTMVMCLKTIHKGEHTFEEGKKYEYQEDGSFCKIHGMGKYEVYSKSPIPWVFETDEFLKYFEIIDFKIEILEREIQHKKQEIHSFKTLIASAKELFSNKEDCDNYSEYGCDAISFLQDFLQRLKKDLKNLQHDLKTYQESVTDKNIGVMFFKAGHRDFRSDEISQMLKDIRKFEEHPIEKDIDFGMSDDALLFVSEDVEQKEAQAMWKYFCEYGFDVMEFGDLLTWNGREFVDGNGIPFETYQQ